MVGHLPRFTAHNPRTGHVIGTEAVMVGTESVETVHVHLDDVVSGDSTGQTQTDLWLEPSSGLLVRQVSNPETGNATPIGQVTFHETIDLTLTSTAPQR